MRLLIATALAAIALAAASGQASSPAPKAAPSEGFRQEGSIYVATGVGAAPTQSEAQEKARGAALRALFSGLGKDRLFAEVFIGAPPVGLAFAVNSSSKELSGYRVSITLRIDDESIRIVERGQYLAAAVAILDQAEAADRSAAAQAARGSAAESEGRLGEALGAYGMAQDSSRNGLHVMESVGDTTVFSTKGKRSAPDLRRSLAAARDAAAAGIARVGKAEAALAADDSSKAASEVVDKALAAADKAQAVLDEAAPVVENVTAYGADRLVPLRDKLTFARRSLSDSKAALDRASPTLPKDRSYLRDKLEYARRRLTTQDGSLEAAWRIVDLEIRDPAVRRAARAQALRWAFLHVPKEQLSLRLYAPFALPYGGGFEFAAPDVSAAAEGAFGTNGGPWARTAIGTSRYELRSDSGSADEFRLHQSFDLGFWGRSLFFAGYAWDWSRSVEGRGVDPSRGLVRLGMGGVSREAGFSRADWNVALSYELPYKCDRILLWNVVNAGLDAQFRLGTVAVLEASIAHRAHPNPESDSGYGFDAVFSWSAAAALRLPPPFSLGAEYRGSLARPIKKSGSDDSAAVGGGSFRFFLGYSL